MHDLGFLQWKENAAKGVEAGQLYHYWLAKVDVESPTWLENNNVLN